MSKATEELVLTFNDKGRRLKRSDFETAFAKSELDKKVVENIFLIRRGFSTMVRGY